MKRNGIPIPSIDTCCRLMADMGMMDHIAAHSVQVYLAASKLADLSLSRGLELNRDLIYSAALLHDITKTRSLETGENHAATGSELLNSLGYPEVAGIVAQHVRLYGVPDQSSPIREVEFVNYADKRVLHDRVTSLHERRRYILDRYGSDPDRRELIGTIFDEAFVLEDRIFGLLDMPSSDLEVLAGSPYESKELELFRIFAETRSCSGNNRIDPVLKETMP